MKGLNFGGYMKIIDADELKSKKEYSAERHEWIVPVAAIDWLNAIEVVPVVHGQWLMDRKDHCYCSNCENGRNIVTQIGWEYCPNCGIKMDKI